MNKTKEINKYGSICFFMLLCILFLTNCTPKYPDETIAQVGDKILYRTQLDEFIPKNISQEDSILYANNYIDKWVKRQLLIKKANENLSSEQKNVEEEVENYRNELIVYKYKNELIKQRMDTVVTQTQIDSYYNTHKMDFNLNYCIVKAIFLKIPTDLANPRLIKYLAYDISDEGYVELRDYCSQYAKKINISANSWIKFQTLKKNIPKNISDNKTFLKTHEVYENSDSTYYYFVRIIDYKLPGDVAPAGYCKNNIRNLILNKRKLDFLKQLEDNIYKEGIRKNKFQIFDDNITE